MGSQENLVVRKGRTTKKPSRKGSTRDNIIRRSILLFNRYGLREVAVGRIASDMKISVGNLTYHFPRKQQLILAALETTKAELLAVLQHPDKFTAEKRGGEYTIQIVRTLWNNRYFFNSLTYVLTDPELKQGYMELRQSAIEHIEESIQFLCDAGYYHAPSPPNSFHLLAENMWELWLSWLRMQQVRSPRAKMPKDADIYDCALHTWSLIQPSMKPEHSNDLLQQFQELLLE